MASWQPDRIAAVWLGAAAANAPDLDTLTVLLPSLRRGPVQRFWDWHCRIQRETSQLAGVYTAPDPLEGDDHNEPIADAVRGILDGHIVLERSIAERGRYPAVNVLRSLSRTMPNCNSDAEIDIVRRARQHLSVYEDMAELIRLGAYRKGTDPAVDEAIRLYPAIEAFLGQKRGEHSDLFTGYCRLADVLGLPHPDAEPVGTAKAVDA